MCAGVPAGKTLRALHAAVLDMREGGHRRVRTQLGDPNFGYGESDLPKAFVRHQHGMAERRLNREWLMDVDVELISVAATKPTRAQMLQRWLGVESLLKGAHEPGPVAAVRGGRVGGD
eukprot:2057544-Prymnesium_polylepis.1